MSYHVILPSPTNTLRLLITETGYRPCLSSKGIDKDLDDLALERRESSNFELLQDCQEQWLQAIHEDCGFDWFDLVDSAWKRYRSILQSFARETDTTGMVLEHAKNALTKLLVIPELSGFIRRANKEIPLFDVKNWWEAPFSAWLSAAATESALPATELLDRLANHLDIDQRTLERWQQGGPLGKGLWPYRATTLALLSGCGLTDRQVERFTGWLVVAVALQSLPMERRDSIGRDFHTQGKSPLRSEEEARIQLKREAADRSSLPLRDYVGPVLADVEKLFADTQSNAPKIRDRLNWLRSVLEKCSRPHRESIEHLWLLLSARLEANVGDEDKALCLYADASRQAWWRAGRNQHVILHEALCFAVGTNNKVQAKRYWDKCFLLGLNKPPKRELDDQEMRRLSFEFQRLYAPKKSKYRIPPPIRFVLMDKPFSLTAKELTNPNRKRADADGRVRYTPLMEAVMKGTLEDVKQAVHAGGDPNVFIPESGENALIMALRRANDRKDPDILNFLLTLDISPATANRPASTLRETPLKIALEMADASVVTRLIELGADVEEKCFTAPSALIAAMALLYNSVHVSASEQLREYLSGRGLADSFDAKHGAILDCELPEQRKELLAIQQDPKSRQLFESVIKYYERPFDARRKVVFALLKKGAKPDRRYPDFHGHRDLWTPTLFAAQLGDLDVLKAMIEAGGDPWLTLEDGSPYNERNALWVAVTYQRQPIVDFLLPQLPKGFRS